MLSQRSSLPVFLSGLLLTITVFLLSAQTNQPQPKKDDEKTLPPHLKLKQPGIKLTVVAEHPDIMTPTGIDVDSDGTIWAIASHTHFRPKDYDGPRKDQVLTFTSQGKRTVFYENTEATMDLELGKDGWVYLAERDRVLRIRDTNKDGKADKEETLITLTTEADYPHNGLEGLAFHPNGDLLFTLGDNYSKDWIMTDRAGKKFSGSGEGGIFRCLPEGKKLHRIARGFWNPFGLCVRADGEIFAAENDPGSRPPCRLLHIVEGGDYGYQRSFGNAAFHPFVCWNGELPGTLPMIHPLSEAPSGIAPLGGGLVVTSWSDNRLDYYALKRQGATFTARKIPLVQGGEFFRPTCLVQASDNVFYFTDWVFGSYQLHKKGRVWKMEIDPAKADWLTPRKTEPPNREAKLAQQLRNDTIKLTEEKLFSLANEKDAFLARAALTALARKVPTWTDEKLRKLSIKDRISAALANKIADPKNHQRVELFLNDKNASVQFEALRWIAEENLRQMKPQVEKLLKKGDADFAMFEATLATWNTLNGNQSSGVNDPEKLLSRLRDSSAPKRTKAFALRLLPPQHKQLTLILFRKLLSENEPLLSLEVVRSLAHRADPGSGKLLLTISKDAKQPAQLRAEAITGLNAANPEQRTALLNFAMDKSRIIREEALRSLRFATLSGKEKRLFDKVRNRYPNSADLIGVLLNPDALAQKERITMSLDGWKQRLKSLNTSADPQAGKRLFFHPRLALCSTCHRHRGRGNVVGPDLSVVGQQGNEDRLLQSLLQPSKDVAPQYFPWIVELSDGKFFTGIPLRKGGRGKEYYRDNTGKERSFHTDDIVSTRELRTSFMPDDLVKTLTDREVRDLLAFLSRSQ